MSALNTRDNFGWVTRTVHWLSFFIVIALIAGGKYSDSLPQDSKIPFLIDAHKQLGIALFIFVVFRLSWRLVSPMPEHIGEGLTAFTSGLVHLLIYFSLMFQAYIGVAMSQLFKRDVSFFGLFELPNITDSTAGLLNFISIFHSFSAESAGRQMRELHSLVGDGIIILIALHIGGALWHHMIIRDDTLRRMMPGYKPLYHRKDATIYDEPKK